MTDKKRTVSQSSLSPNSVKFIPADELGADRYADDVTVFESQLPDIAFDEDGYPIVPNILVDWSAWVTATKERDVNLPSGPGHNLRDYWVRGPGAVKIRWNTDGDFTRCVKHLRKYVTRPQGLCAEYHRMATGKHPHPHPGRPTESGETITVGDETCYDVAEAAQHQEVSAVTADAVVSAGKSVKLPSSDDVAPEEPVVEEPVDEEPENAMPMIAPIKTAQWSGVLTVEGVESGDSRMFASGSLTWDEPPLPLMWQKETSHGGDNNVSVRVGSVERIWREPSPSGDEGVNIIRGEGTIDLGGEDGREVFRRMRDRYLSGNSVDVDSVKSSAIELRFDESAGDGEGGEGGDVVQQLFGQKPDMTVYKRGRIRATTLVEIPAFTEARLSLKDVPSMAVPFADVESMEMEGVDIIAAAGVIEIPDLPPREWFEEPTDVPVDGALTITPEGRIYGYVAPAGVRHRSFPGREQYVPLGNVDYSRFMSGQTIVADGGRIATGAITMNCGHASTVRSLTASQASAHYDNSCSVVATARVGENERGVWIAGALINGLEPATIQRIMACKLSGDWRGHLDRPGWREFVAALLVPVPGFPMARRIASLEIADGQLVASAVPVTLATSDAANANLDVPAARNLNAAARRECARRGWAMPNGSYPIRDAAHHGLNDLSDAIRAVGRGNAPHNEIRRHIMERARALGAADRIPDNWTPDGGLKASSAETVAALTLKVRRARSRALVAAAKKRRKC